MDAEMVRQHADAIQQSSVEHCPIPDFPSAIMGRRHISVKVF
jgi:hypothetical protein